VSENFDGTLEQIPAPARPLASTPARIMLLDLDGVVLMRLLHAVYDDPLVQMLGGHPDRVVETKWLPADVVRLQHRALTVDRMTKSWYRPAVVTALRDLRESGVREIWNTSWLIDTKRLTEVADAIEMGFVEYPHVEKMNPPLSNRAIPERWSGFLSHWKVRTARRWAATGRGC
jgi:hypothetical protein